MTLAAFTYTDPEWGYIDPEWETPIVEDDEGNWWAKCGDTNCDLGVVSPGHAQCSGFCNGLEGWPYQEKDQP